MHCPRCHAENDGMQKFCRGCGAKLQMTCPDCGTIVMLGDKFCGECGLELRLEEKLPKKGIAVERKHITALFADVSDYTSLAERLDPEEVSNIMNILFGEIAKIVSKYEGSIDRIAGDAVMVLFGTPWSHEDDPVRALRTAQEIHRIVGALSLRLQEKVGAPLSMHIGINSGLVVTGKVHLKDWTNHSAGDTLNIASRLCSLAKANETLVGHATYSQAEGFFLFESLEPVKVKGRTKPVLAYKLLSAMEFPIKRHRISGLRADLIGRETEMASLKGALEKLLGGQGAVISICGEAGTGKSRIIEEFKSSLNLATVQWFEGHAYAYGQNIPYYPIIDLLNRIFQIHENDPPEAAREKAERIIKAVVGDGKDVIPYVGKVLSIPYQEVENVSPDVFKGRFHAAVLAFFSGLIRRAPTVLSLEDLHWADPSSLELLHHLWNKLAHATLFLYTCRPPLPILAENQTEELSKYHVELQLKDLSPPETQKMVGSLLGTQAIPPALKQFIFEKIGGNPFFVEEMVNSLIEFGLLIQENGSWHYRDAIDIMLPATVQGLITARIDRLDILTREVLQEASVIGRTFYQDILDKITTIGEPIDLYLRKLKDHDLIRVGSTHPDIEYSFKHALIQEVVYNGLSKRQRQDIHERVGLALEKFFGDRGLESWETLAFHFKRGHSLHKASDNLAKSGEKALERYALESASQYYGEAFNLLAKNQARSKEEDFLLVDLLMKWCLVYYYQGHFKRMTELLLTHLDLAESLDNKAMLGAYLTWLGHSTFWQGARLNDSYQYLHKALELGEQTEDRQVIAFACAFLIKTCAEMGHLEEAVFFEKRTEEMIGLFPADAFLYMTYYSGKGWIGWFTGDKHRLYEGAIALLDYGQKMSSLRCEMVGTLLMGFRHFIDLGVEKAIEYTKKVIAQADPYHVVFARLILGMYLVHMGDFESAAQKLTKVVEYSDKHGTEYMKPVAHLFLGVALAGQRQVGEGISLIESAAREFKEYQRTVFCCLAETILGGVYLQILQRSGNLSFSFLYKNLGFLIKNVPFARKKAERHLKNAVQLAKETGAKGFLGPPLLQLGLLHKVKGNREQAKEYLGEAMKVFQECELEAYVRRTKELLDSLT